MYEPTVKIRFRGIPSQQLLGLLLELVLFAMFFGAFWQLLTLQTPRSNWAMVPHVLCNAGLLLLVARHYLEDRPPIYWSHFDVVVLVLFAWIAINVYYSEVRAISWRASALYLDSLAAFFFGRLLFYRRVRGYVIALLLALAAVYIRALLLRQHQIAAAEPDELLIEKLNQVLRIVTLAAVFWLIALPFLMIRRPNNLAFLVFTALILGSYAVLVAQRLGWIFAPAMESGNIDWRHQRFLTLETAWRIVRNFPFTGCGIGTFPILFEAYKQTPTVPYVASFNAYLYCIVELGVGGLMLLLYLFVRYPLHIMRRWRLFPNRRLRLAVYVFFWFVVLVLFQGFYDPDVFSPGAWFLIWTSFGVLASLVEVRDPMRVFESPFWGVPKREVTAAGEVGRRRFIRLTDATKLAVLLLFLVIFTVAEAAPYLADTLARKRQNEEISSPEYGRRLQLATRIFPLLPDVWAKLAMHYQQQVQQELQIYTYLDRIERAYQRAIKLNPFQPQLYEQLAFQYIDTNNAGKALDVLKEGTRNNPNNFVLRMLLVRELERIGSLSLATYHVKQALFRIAPDQVDLFLRLAELYERRGQRAAALRYMQYAEQVVTRSEQSQARLRRLKQRLRA